MDIPARLNALREELANRSLDAFIVPSSDPHQSEYVASHWEIRAWLSGFTGSAGILVVTADYAGLWTDSRYFLQAEQQLEGTGITMHKQGVPYAPEHLGWLGQRLHATATVGVDGRLFSVNQVRRMLRVFDEYDIHLDYEQDPIAAIWTDRPPRPDRPVVRHDLVYAGLSRAAKFQRVRSKMAEEEADYYLVSTLDDVAWVLNLRSDDVAFNPVFVAYLVIGKTSAFLFIDPDKVAEDLAAELQEDGVQLKPYDQVGAFLANRLPNNQVWLDLATTHIQHYNQLKEEQRLPGKNLIQPLKACKNETEITHIREAMRKDGIALTRFHRWLEAALASGEKPTEYEVSERLANFRSEQEGYRGESFAAIVGYRSNGAIVHYRPMPDTSAVIEPEGILLVDSGGQYIDGTTDITRTIALSTPTPDQKRHYTLVLRGHIALSRQVFPAGTTGIQLDTLARQHLWGAALNYGHGTGHGVGFFLNVHEGPQSIAPNPRSPRTQQPLKPGMLTSNEPGYYLAGHYGMRIENLILCKEYLETDQGAFYEFEPLTLFPITTDLIDLSLMTAEDIAWLNNYHQQVYDELAPLLEESDRLWLRGKCQPLAP